MSSSSFLDSYEPLDVIGNGSFGIIRKVRRKSDGLLFARKELNFERMSERDRKQIVSEVNILKDLHHDHIVRYHDRHVDRDAGILYILMEYCGGGDLSAVIKQAAKQNRPIPEDTIWHYFLQILHALHHCHHPNGHGHARSSSGSGLTGTSLDAEGSSRRVQILHRDLKPDNVFLDENNTVKLGDFGLSKALAQASFASTYVGTPYYMSPELMQEKSYDSKSDIWSLGCLIYELCALKPPFHEAKTHSELSIFIRNGRIPPLPRGYSQALTSVIKSMLNLNPAMRPSAAQLLQHERLELVNKVAETEKMLSAVKAHRAAVSAKEREVLEREHNLRESEQHLTAVLNSKDQEIAALQHLVAQLREQLQSSSQTQQQPQYTRQDIEHAAKQAVARREEELRVLVMKREEEVALAIAKREEEIMEAVRAREVEIDQACVRREEAVRKEVEERVQWVLDREAALRAEERRLEDVKREVEAGMRKVEAGLTKGRKEKNPLEEVKNLLEPLSRATAQVTPSQPRRRKQEPQLTPRPNPSQQANSNHTSNNNHTNTSTSNSGATNTTTTNNNNNNTNNNHTIMATNAGLETPTASRPFATYSSEFMPASAMKGVVLTATGETLATPSPAELVSLFTRSPKVGLDFGKIFEFREGNGNVNGNPKQKQPQPQLNLQQQQHHQQFQQHRAQAHVLDDDEELDSPPPSPSERKERERRDNTTTTTTASWPPTAPPPTRIRRPSIRTSARSAPARSSGFPPSTASSSDSSSGHSNAAGPSSNHTNNHNNTTANNPKPLPHPHLRSSRSISNLASAHAAAHAAAAAGRVPLPPAPVYDLADEENLPSPFLKRTLPNASRPNSHQSSSSANACASSSSNTAAVGAGGAGTGAGAASTKAKRRGSSGLLLRAVAAANNAGRTRSAGALPSPESDGEIAQAHGQGQGQGPSPTAASYASTTVGGVCFPLNESGVGEAARPSLASARKASEDARKALLRP